MNELKSFCAVKHFCMLLIISFCTVFSGCYPVTKADGTVKMTNGEPIENVKIIVEQTQKLRIDGNGENQYFDFLPIEEITTDIKGKYYFTKATSPSSKIRLILKKEGYEVSQQEIPVGETTSLDIILSKKYENK